MDGKNLYLMMLKNGVDHGCKTVKKAVQSCCLQFSGNLYPLPHSVAKGSKTTFFFFLLITSCFSERLPAPVLEGLHEKNPEK